MTMVSNTRMKKIICMALTMVFVMSTLIAIQPVNAEDSKLYNDTMHHLFVKDGLVADQEWKSESNKMIDSSKSIEFDIAGFVIGSETLKDYGLDYYLTTIYDQNGMGYGVNSDGIVLGIDIENQNFMLRTFGRGNKIFSKDKIVEVSKAVRSGWESGSYIGALEAYRGKVVEIVSASDIKRSDSEKDYGKGFTMKAAPLVGKTAPADTEKAQEPVKEEPVKDETSPEKTEVKLPDWYVTDPSTFVDFHNDPSEPRLIDNADILTPEEENTINKAISRIADQQNIDIVIYTDTTSYGMDNLLYANDFYTYKGYGYGENYDGVILFVNMDPDNREMVTSACGAPREEFTAGNSSKLDDMLYNKFVDKKYGEGVLDWLNGVDTLYSYGVFNAPQWYKDYVDGTLPADVNKYKLVDDSGYFTDAQGKEISDRLRKLSDETGYDFVFYVTPYAYNLTGADNDKDRVKGFTDLFYKAHGYGLGENKSAVLITFYTGDNSSYASMVTAYGDAKDKFTPKICSRLGDIGLLNLSSGEYEKNINRVLYYTELFLEKGKLPHTWPVRIFWFILCVIAGAVPAIISINRAYKQMNLVSEQTSAAGELVEGSFRILYSRDIKTGTRVSRIYDPVKTDSGSSSSSGGGGSSSSYSSSSYSSSGREFSSSRRSF